MMNRPYKTSSLSGVHWLLIEALCFSLLIVLIFSHFYKLRVEQIFESAVLEADAFLRQVNDRIANYVRGFGKDIGTLGRVLYARINRDRGNESGIALPDDLIEAILLGRQEYQFVLFNDEINGQEVRYERNGVNGVHRIEQKSPGNSFPVQKIQEPREVGSLYISAVETTEDGGNVTLQVDYSLMLDKTAGNRYREIVVGLSGEGLLESIRYMTRDFPARFYLVNEEGGWLIDKENATKQSVQAVNKGQFAFIDRYPRLWAVLLSGGDEGIWMNETGDLRVSYYRLDPVRYLTILGEGFQDVPLLNRIESNGKSWMMISLIGKEELEAELTVIRRNAFLILTIGFLMLFFFYLLRYRSLKYREQNRKNLELAYFDLEQMAEKRNEDLAESNRQLSLQNEDLRRLQHRTQEQRNFLQEIIDSLSHPFFVADPENRTILLSNKAGRERLGCDENGSEPTFDQLQSLCAEAGGECPIATVLESGQSFVVERTRAGRSALNESVEVSVFPVKQLEKDSNKVIVYFVDTTERHRLQEQFIQAQKMEAVGQLAGGIAHDFNNLLSVMIGYSEQLLEEMGQDSEYIKRMSDIHRAALKAGDLTQKLLLFSRKHPHKPRPIDINEVVVSLLDLIRPIIGVHLNVELQCSENLFTVVIDRSQFEQVVMNILVNARDAMPNGGKILISTRNLVFKKNFLWQDMEIKKGPHVMVSIEDNGLGMEPAVLDRVFEPFFTTKKEKEGTGLGLSTVYGIIKQSGGFIHASSRIGRGTRFRVFIPARRDSSEVQEEIKARKTESQARNELILLVDDDRNVREMISIALLKKGYRVLSTGDGQDALRLLRDHSDGIRMVLSDVVMPRMSGVELAIRVREIGPGIPVLLMSGYMTDQLQEYRLHKEEWPLIQKPFSFQELFMEMRKLLDKTDQSEDQSI